MDKASQKAERRQNKRDPEAILRKRAKQRVKYIAKLVADGELHSAGQLILIVPCVPLATRLSSGATVRTLLYLRVTVWHGTQ